MAKKGFNVNGFSFSCFVLQGKFAITSGREKRNKYLGISANKVRLTESG